MHNRSPYEILGLPETATLDQLKEAYKRAALDNHPDKIKQANPKANDQELHQLTQEATERFKEITAAYRKILKRLAKKNQEPEPIHTQDHAHDFDIAPDAIVTEGARIMVCLPILVSGTYSTFFLPMCITMSELEQPSKFIRLREKINDTLAREKSQVGIDHIEAKAIIDQKSWYKQKALIFVGWVQISLPLCHLKSRSVKSSARTKPYFWIKKGSQIELSDILSFHFPSVDQIYPWNRTEYIETLAEQSKNGILNNATTSQDSFLITPETQALFDWKGGVSLTPEGISAALSAYQAELRHIAKYHSQIAKVLEAAQALAQLYHNPVMSIDKKLEQLQSLLPTSFGRQYHTSPFDILEKAIREYYQNPPAPRPATPVTKSTPASSSSISSTTNAPLQETTASNAPLQETNTPAPVNTASFFSTVPSTKTTETNPQISILMSFLDTEISRIQTNMQATPSASEKSLLGWITHSHSSSSTSAHSENSNRSQSKLNLLIALRDWLQTTALSDNNKIKSVILLAHSLCALKQSPDPRKTKSQEKIEDAFLITSDPLLSEEEIDAAKFPSNINSLLETIEEKQISKTSACTIQ